MIMNAENLRFILGLKLKQYRAKKGYSLKELAEKTRLSISFLSEIEKGKKYPKPEKLMLLAHALDTSFDDLVSLKVDEELDPLTSILDSPFVKEFPFEIFGMAPRDLLNLVT
ncbi:MAG: helix-turn-helix domain-containing protein, partial [bacterium]